MLLRKVRAPSQTRRHESVLLENALSFGQLSRGPAVCVHVCAAAALSSCWIPIRLSGGDDETLAVLAIPS